MYLNVSSSSFMFHKQVLELVPLIYIYYHIKSSNLPTQVFSGFTHLGPIWVTHRRAQTSPAFYSSIWAPCGLNFLPAVAPYGPKNNIFALIGLSSRFTATVNKWNMVPFNAGSWEKLRSLTDATVNPESTRACCSEQQPRKPSAAGVSHVHVETSRSQNRFIHSKYHLYF